MCKVAVEILVYELKDNDDVTIVRREDYIISDSLHEHVHK